MHISSRFLLLTIFTFSPLIILAQEDTQTINNGVTDVEEIVVTATSRESSLLDVPYNISTISGSDIQERGIQDATELLRNFAGISTIDRGYRNAGTTNSARIRGLNVDSSALQDYPVSSVASVSTYVDKTPVFANFLLKDLKRVEVLRGPQGTLYGSGALGGTIRYITNDPIIGEMAGTINVTTSDVTGSNSLGTAIDLVLNVPISDKMAYRVAYSYADYPGITDYVNVFRVSDIPGFDSWFGPVDPSYGVPTPKEGTGFPDFITSPPSIKTVQDADTVGINFLRHKFLFDINENIELMFTATTQEDEVGGRRQSSTGTKYILNENCTTLQDPNCYSTGKYGKFENGALMLEPSEREVEVYASELTYDADNYDLIVSYSTYEKSGSSITDNTGYFAGAEVYTSALAGYYNQTAGGIWTTPARPYSPAHRQYTDAADTLEIKLVSEVSDTFDYILGYFNQTEEMSRSQQTYIKGVNAWKGYYWGVDYVIDPNEQDFDYNVSESIDHEAFYGEFTFHLADEYDLTLGFRDFTSNADASMNMAFKLYNIGPATDSSSNSDSDTLLKANLSYKPADNVTYFATMSEGFRRGGVNAVPTEGTFVEEAGWVPFQSDTVTNLEIGVKGFIGDTYYNMSLYNITWDNPQLNTSTPIYGYYAVINGQEAETKGMDIELQGVVGSLDWNIGYAFNDTNLTEDLYTPASIPVLYASKGAKLPGSPEHMINIGLAYTHYFKSGIGVAQRMDYYSQSDTRNYIGENSQYDAKFDGFRIINMSSTFFQDNTYLSIFVKNIGNERGVTGAFLNPAFGPSPSQGFYGSNNREFFALPRTVGISLNRTF
jgi:iron complex outermembrane receptor protein|tara:strand:+ start:16401 stop:18896 length:2496 start_codon:yes stop_codon:yes gene_type:complete